MLFDVRVLDKPGVPTTTQTGNPRKTFQTFRSEIVGFSGFLAGALARPRADGANHAGVFGTQDGLLPVLAPKLIVVPGKQRSQEKATEGNRRQQKARVESIRKKSSTRRHGRATEDDRRQQKATEMRRGRS